MERARTRPKTAEGIERIRRAVTKHGFYSKVAQEERRRGRATLRELGALTGRLRSELFRIEE